MPKIAVWNAVKDRLLNDNIIFEIASTKDERFYVRVSSRMKQDFELVAEYRGLTPSAMLHSFMKK
ncbi:MAG TPA: hypothetical protein VK892_17125 [Pyrinomonadaceae bacterium]|nr:hypothetical protein [Pyrinomonadaceae bacterium]